MFIAVLVKLLWTNDITRPMRKHSFAFVLTTPDKFKKWKFFVMGTLSGLGNLLLSVSGSKLDGMLQLLLMQCKCECLPA